MGRPLGQHFLFDKNILKKIIRYSGITKKDTVVEIGPGLGPLTALLAESAGRVVALEKDRKLIDRLSENLKGYDNVEIVSTDALKYPYETLGDSFRVVANIPYYITTPIIFNLLEYRASLKSMTLLMQKEVGRRIVAVPPGREYGVLSISTQLYTRPELKFTVSRKAFSPPPAVDSAVVHFDVSPVPLYDVGDAQLFRSIVKACFSQRRKTILNGLKAFEGIREALDAAGIDPVVRPETLSIDKFADLARCLRK